MDISLHILSILSISEQVYYKHGVLRFSLIILWHTNASLMIASGADIVTVSGRLGPADKNVTLNIYSHMIKSREALIANQMDQFYKDANLDDRISL